MRRRRTGDSGDGERTTDGRGGRTDDGADRGQVVLLAAAVVAVALVAMLLAYAQLGYHADVRASAARPPPTTDANRLLGAAVHDASAEVDGNFSWANRTGAAGRVNGTLGPRTRRVETARSADGVVVTVDQNGTAASRWAGAHCPGGPMRQFGPCEARGGVVLQERAGETTLLAVAFDVHANSTRRDVRETAVVRAV